MTSKNNKPFKQPGGDPAPADGEMGDRGARSDRAARLRLDRQAMAYLEALDAHDLDAVGRLWEQAADDAELERVLMELSDGILEEAGQAVPTAGFAEDAAKIVRLLGQHVPSGVPAPKPARPTVAEVAAKIAADPDLNSRLDSADREANVKLITVQGELPAELGVPQLTRWKEGLPVSASPLLIGACSAQAIFALVRHTGQGQGGSLAAARPVARRPAPDKRNSGKKAAGDRSGKPSSSGKQGPKKNDTPDNEAT